jgi:hypothetical protein
MSWDLVSCCVCAGLGKTVQIIAFLAAVYEKSGSLTDVDTNRLILTGHKKVKPSLIISPRWGNGICCLRRRFVAFTSK